MSSIDPPRQRRILASLVVSAILIWIDSTVLGIALERLADPVDGLGATPGQLQWAIGVYSLLFATALFAAGALGDRYGHRTVLMLGLVVFGASSAWAAWAGGPVELILARATMGLGGALIMPTSMAIIGWTFPPERRAGAIAVWSSSAGLGVAVGPVLGGLLIDHFWWGSVFLINLPIVAAGLVGAALVLPNPRSPQRRRLDPRGLALSTLGLLGLSYGLIEGGHQGGWNRWQVWASIAAGLALLAAFIYSEWRESEPSFDPRLFRNRRFAAGNLALAALFLTLTGQSFYLAFYLQGARGMSALDAGLMSLPSATGVVLGSPIGARLAARFGVARISGTALVAFALCHALNLTYDVDTSLVWVAAVGALAGLSIGVAVAPTTAAVIATLPMERIGAGSAVNNAIRQVGSVLGVAVLGTIVSSTYQHQVEPHLPATIRDAGVSAEATRHVARAIGRPDLVDLANYTFIHAMHTAALVASAITLTGAIVLTLAFRAKRRTAEEIQVAVDA
ncbi:EmrB/QacA subfamily drug resistance transporter [Kribbella antiqua]|uniref:EmrB/QacA subfamily drug resistance transporter n=1 Tax=Kribbella antiqua TaxID=2512217 RepID=A0A4R2IBT2_9ACTN|nr:MFS transporter [Kribbella antiqua]TCO41602.1 EmrB/QacA subfamily drug resistance transporter [Kribbella antiqua]